MPTESLRALKREWRAKNADAIKAAIAEPLAELSEMPYTSVSKDGVEYRIHGTVHGQRRFAKLQPRMLEWMRTNVERMSNPPDEDFVTERRFARLLGFPRERELDYMRDLLRAVGPRKVLLLVVLSLTALVWGPLAVIALRLSRDPVTRAMRASLADERHLPRLRKLYALTELPSEVVFERMPDAFNVIHSRLMAERAVEYAKQHDVKVLHVVCGLAHEPDLALLLSR